MRDVRIAGFKLLYSSTNCKPPDSLTYLDSQQHFSCIFPLILHTNLPSFTEQQHDLTSFPLSVQTIFAANAGTANTAIADNTNNARFMAGF